MEDVYANLQKLTEVIKWKQYICWAHFTIYLLHDLEQKKKDKLYHYIVRFGSSFWSIKSS